MSKVNFINLDDVFTTKKLMFENNPGENPTTPLTDVRFCYAKAGASYDVLDGGKMVKQLYDVPNYKSLGNELIDKLYYSFLYDQWVKSLKSKVVELDVIQMRILDELRCLNELLKYTDANNVRALKSSRPAMAYVIGCYPEFKDGYFSIFNEYRDNYSVIQEIPIETWSYNTLGVQYSKASKSEYSDRILAPVNTIYNNLCSDAEQNNREGAVIVKEKLLDLAVETGILNDNGEPKFFLESEIRERMRLDGQELSKWSLF